MATFISILIIILCLLLAVIVLVQNPKGGGLDSSFGSASQLGGVQKTTDFLEKATWGLAITIVILCLVSTTMTTTNVAPQDAIQDEYMDEAPIAQPQPEAIPLEEPTAE